MSVKFSLVVGAAIACAVMTGCKSTKVKPSNGNVVAPTRSVQRADVVIVDEHPAQQPEQKVVIVEEEKEEEEEEEESSENEGGEVNGEGVVVDLGKALSKLLSECEDISIVMNVTYGLLNG